MSTKKQPTLSPEAEAAAVAYALAQAELLSAQAGMLRAHARLLNLYADDLQALQNLDFEGFFEKEMGVRSMEMILHEFAELRQMLTQLLVRARAQEAGTTHIDDYLAQQGEQGATREVAS